ASPAFLNCRIVGNGSATTANGAAIFASANANVRVSHTTISDNTRQNGGGQIYATGGATVSLNNTILWGASNLGAEIVTSGGTVSATYCDVQGGYSGAGNINANPLFEANGTYRLTLNSPCIDVGSGTSFPGFNLLVQSDMDGEARLSKALNA